MSALPTLPPIAQALILLLLANVFMTFAWYGHLKSLATAPWYIAALVSWGFACWVPFISFSEISPPSWRYL
jgi:uncharacterized protein (DUF486 family)